MAIQKVAYPPSKRHPNGRSVYRVQIRSRGESASETFDRLSDARAWERLQLTRLDQGKHGAMAADRHLLADLFARYARDVIPNKKPWAAADQPRHLNEWLRLLGNVRLAMVTPNRIQLALKTIAETPYRKVIGGKEYRRAAGTVNAYLATLSHCFSKAADWGMVETNPCARVDQLRTPKDRVRFLSGDERTRLLAETVKNPCLHTIVLCALSTGARDMNVRAWKWRDVDLVNGRALVEDTKNGQRQMLHIAGDALAQLHKWAAKRRVDSEYVFPSRDGKKPVAISSSWARARKRAGLYSADRNLSFRFHDLRHTTASDLAANGESLITIGSVLGHKTAQMTKKYAHLTEQHQADAVRRMMERKRARPAEEA